LGYLFTVTTCTFEITATKYFVNMNGTVYGKRLPKGTQVTKSLGTTGQGSEKFKSQIAQYPDHAGLEGHNAVSSGERLPTLRRIAD
jgi:hypothetical protein